MKPQDHVVREVVNDLRDIAIKFHDTDQLRERLRGALAPLLKPSSVGAFDFAAHLTRQALFSEKTFGPGLRTAGVSDHIRKELLEVAAAPADLNEWIDVVILALDGAWRTGATPTQIIDGIVSKQARNEGRTWPDWRTVDSSKAIEHDRTGEAPTILYRFDRFNKAGQIMAEGIAVHATSMSEAEAKARAMMHPKDERIAFRNNDPCHQARRCSICSTAGAPAAPVA